MSFDYPAAQAVATELIEFFGSTATLEKPGTMTGPAHNQTAGPATTSTVKAVEVESELTDRDGNRVERADKVFYIAADATEPGKDDRLQFQGDWYSIVSVMPLSPAGTNVYFECEVVR